MATDSHPRLARHLPAVACRTRTDGHPDWQRNLPVQVIGPNRLGQARAHEKETSRTVVLYNDPLMQSPERGLLGDWAKAGADSEFRRRLMGESLLPRLVSRWGPHVGRRTW